MDKWRGTKGKWEAKHESKEFCDTSEYEYYATIEDEQGKCIAQFFTKDEEQREADVILASAAPELLEDLQEAVSLFESAYKCMADGDNEGLYNTLANATSRSTFKQTISKALGKEEGDE